MKNVIVRECVNVCVLLCVSASAQKNNCTYKFFN